MPLNRRTLFAANSSHWPPSARRPAASDSQGLSSEGYARAALANASQATIRPAASEHAVAMARPIRARRESGIRGASAATIGRRRKGATKTLVGCVQSATGNRTSAPANQRHAAPRSVTPSSARYTTRPVQNTDCDGSWQIRLCAMAVGRTASATVWIQAVVSPYSRRAKKKPATSASRLAAAGTSRSSANDGEPIACRSATGTRKNRSIGLPLVVRGS